MTQTYSPAEFIKRMSRHNYSRIGVYALIHAHLGLAPHRRMSRPGIHAALRTKSPFSVELVDNVIDASFVTDADGLVFSKDAA